MNPDNAIIGDMTSVELPQAAPNEDYVNELRKKARYSKSKEFKELRELMELRIDYYKQYVPDGRPVSTVPSEELRDWWKLANIVIAELSAVISAYDGAVELLKDYDEQEDA